MPLHGFRPVLPYLYRLGYRVLDDKREDARRLSEAAPAVAVAVSAGSGAGAERACACAAWPPRRQPAPHEILRPKPRR
ncbi:hypothetical protein KGM_215956 [Danaus plexippus plexippus]|uniref:Uncharacterized protein n=1 Tax=Danaus plexippus plexippus TaxID=278856 RepID=A0A212EVN8_DANPL|nr:hypothetical protein KGM_215956 [Danaus plexippus plexippus]